MNTDRTGSQSWSSAVTSLPTTQWRQAIIDRVSGGERFAGLYATHRRETVAVVAMLATSTNIECLETSLDAHEDGPVHYPCLSLEIPAAFWYERAAHDLSGVIPDGHPRLDSLVLPEAEGGYRPRPGFALTEVEQTWVERGGPADVAGRGVFTLPFGPVRSGVMETIEFLIETTGENIPHLNIRPHYKHRGIAKQFEGRTPGDGVLVAERVEGISSVAHALAYCHAVETLAGVTPSPRAQLIRVIHAELERIANHLDVTMRLADAAGLAVATSRFGWHKEVVMRLVSRLCGNRFGRGVVVPGGVHSGLVSAGATLTIELAELHDRVVSDIAALERSASFLDRLRGTGPLLPDRAREHGALGPIGRASGFDDDSRRQRPTDAYPDLPAPRAVDDTVASGDALGRARVRWHEVSTSIDLVLAAVEMLSESPTEVPVEIRSVRDGVSVGWAESAQGETLYRLEISMGRIKRCFARSASFHNLVLFHEVFAGDVFTDLPFIEASFGVCYAGVAM